MCEFYWHGGGGGGVGSGIARLPLSLSSEVSSAHDAKQRHSYCFPILGDPALTLGCVTGGEAINVVTSKTPFTQPIGQSDTADEVAFDQAAPGPVGLWLLALACAPRRPLSATPMPLRASISKAMMSDTTSLSYLSASPWLCNSQLYLWSSRRGHSSVIKGVKSSASAANSARKPAWSWGLAGVSELSDDSVMLRATCFVATAVAEQSADPRVRPLNPRS